MYVFGVVLNQPFETALQQVVTAIKTEDLGFVSDINVQGIVQARLGQDIGGYRILGACAPSIAKRVIDAQPAAGVLLPCQVVVRRMSAKQTAVDFMDPVAVLGLANLPEISEVARDARAVLDRVKIHLTSD